MSHYELTSGNGSAHELSPKGSQFSPKRKKSINLATNIQGTNSTAAENTSKFQAHRPQQQLLNYIEALKFDAKKRMPSSLQNDSDDSILPEDKSLPRGPDTDNKSRPALKSNGNFHPKKSKCNRLEPEQSSNNVRPQKEAAKGTNSTYQVIREWGKRPMLITSEAPWTPANKMYMKALKLAGRASPAPENFLIPQMRQPAAELLSAPPHTNLGFTRPMTYMPVPTSNNICFSPQGFPHMPVVLPTPNASPVGNGPPIGAYIPIPGVNGLTGPVPMEANRPLESYIPYQPEFVYPVPVQPAMTQFQPQSMVYGQLTPQGLWMPIIQQQQPPQQKHQDRP